MFAPCRRHLNPLSSPLPTRLPHRAWVGLWNGFFAHDLPLNFHSGVQLGAPSPDIHWKNFLSSAHVEREVTAQDSDICGKISCSFEPSLCARRMYGAKHRRCHQGIGLILSFSKLWSSRNCWTDS